MIAQDLLDRARDTRDALAEQMIAENQRARNQYAVATIIFAMIGAVGWWIGSPVFWPALGVTVLVAGMSLHAEYLRRTLARAYRRTR